MPPAPELRLTALTVEHLESPGPLATASPRFGWVITGDASDVWQVAYELEVSTGGAVVWNSGRVASPASTAVRYDGAPLGSRTVYDWRVRAWLTGRPEPTPWASSRFETSLLDVGDWRASWVRPAQLPAVRESYSASAALSGAVAPEGQPEERLRPPLRLRQPFRAEQRPSRARLYITAHGIYQAELNGRAIGDEVLAPGFTSYPSRLCFQAYDVTEQLVVGDNVLGVTLADGWYLGRIGLTGASANYGEYLEGIWQLELEYPDGSSQLVVSGPDVTSSPGPWVYADLFIGEYYDARKELSGWSQPGFDHSAWTAVEVRGGGLDQLAPFPGEPVRRILEFPAERVFRDPAGEMVVDLGQVIAGWIRLRITAPAGTHVTLEHSETLDATGSFFNNIMGPNKDQTDHYIARGEPGGEVYEPAFTFHGFRYVRVRGLAADLTADDVTAVVIGSDLQPTAELTTSDERINRLHQNVLWSQRANFLSIPTDCPQRERAGWTGDLQVFAPTAATNANVLPFVERWLADLRVDQLPDGQVPIIVPMIPALADSDGGGELGIGASSAAWSDAVLIVPWVLYERYGDAQVLRENYDAMVKWVEYQTRIAAAELHPRFTGNPPGPERSARQALLWNTGFHFGDWLAPSTLMGAKMPDAAMIAPALTAELIAPMFQAHSLKLLSRVAEVLGRDAEAADYAERHRRVRDAFAAEYIDAQGRLPVQLQGPHVVALAFDLVPEHLKAPMVAHLAGLVHAAGDHLDTGFVSVPYLLDVLWEGGEQELARVLLWQSTLPSWLYEVDHGATTIWETWGAVLPDGTVTPMSMNHYAFGCVDDWIFRRVAGLQPVEPGYRRSRIQPDLAAGFEKVGARHRTPYGELAVEWERAVDEVAVRIHVPHNTQAELVLGDQREVLGSGAHERRVPRS
ncbi:MAG: glycoside hydrolase family 78 protein [Actinobacteria bacterium]|nr:glycoside hydrolase family 78 protein [Actinomycetota bacterium]